MIKYILYILFLLYPLINVYIKEYRIGLLWDAERIVLVPLVLIGLLLIYNSGISGRFTISPLVTAIILFYFYQDFIIYINGNLRDSLVINHLFGVTFLILVDRLKFSHHHLDQYYKVLTFIGLVVIFVSLYQFFFNADFYVGFKKVYREDLIAFQGVYRYQSIFSGLGGYGWYIISIMYILILFRNYPFSNMNNYMLSTLMLIPVALTFTRIYYLFPIIAFFFYLYYKKKIFTGLQTTLFFLLLSITTYFLFLEFENTSFMQERILSASYLQRFHTLGVFFDKFIFSKMLFGWGERQVEEILYIMGRGSGILNGFMQVYVTSGLFGLILFINIFVKFISSAKIIYLKNGNPVFFCLISAIILLNFTSSADNLLIFPFYLIFVLLKIMQQYNNYTPLTHVKE